MTLALALSALALSTLVYLMQRKAAHQRRPMPVRVPIRLRR